jgi:ubiquinone/menaquinone biosynthesis C-methylase UbiE
MNQNTQQSREIAHWRRWQHEVDKYWGWQTSAGHRRVGRRAHLFLELGRMGPKSKVLEVGCGTGEFSARLGPQLGELWAFDLSPDLLPRAEQRARALCPDANLVFQLQDATALTLPDCSFDAAFGCSVLHHLDAARALREVWRVLKPGAWCVFSEPNMLNPQIALQKKVRFLRERVRDTADETAFFAGEARRLLESAGFIRAEVRHFDFLHPGTPAFLLGAVERLGLLLEACPGIRRLSGSLMLHGQKPAGS